MRLKGGKKKRGKVSDLTNENPVNLRYSVPRNCNLSGFASEVSNPKTPTETQEGLKQVLPLTGNYLRSSPT